jgi:hypothetical protein
MTIFAKKTMNVTEWAKVQEQIGALQMALGGPHDLMMLSTDSENGILQQDIYIGLPDALLLKAFPGFEEINREALPDYMATLVAREDGFEERFPDIYGKRRSKFT